MKPLYLYFCTVSFVSQYFTTRNYYFNHLREWKKNPNTEAVLKSPDVISDILIGWQLWNLRVYSIEKRLVRQQRCGR